MEFACHGVSDPLRSAARNSELPLRVVANVKVAFIARQALGTADLRAGHQVWSLLPGVGHASRVSLTAESLSTFCTKPDTLPPIVSVRAPE